MLILLIFTIFFVSITEYVSTMIFKENKIPLFINVKGELLDLSRPRVMGILNATPDSFYSKSRCDADEDILNRAKEILSQGGEIIDIGAYSTRPSCVDITEQEEIKRLSNAVEIVKKEFPDAIISVDTFRSQVARRMVEDFAVDIINDISGGEIDKKMFETVADLNVPYILMHMRGTPQTMMENTKYSNLIEEIFLYFSKKINELRLMGVKDIILDPGFGFSKPIDQNYLLMKHLKNFDLFNRPLLVGISRKSMIYKFTGTSPEEALNGTTILNTYAVGAGANLLRVHDVKEAVETINICNKINNPNS